MVNFPFLTARTAFLIGLLIGKPTGVALNVYRAPFFPEIVSEVPLRVTFTVGSEAELTHSVSGSIVGVAEGVGSNVVVTPTVAVTTGVIVSEGVAVI